jgi:hypothetical protein
MSLNFPQILLAPVLLLVWPLAAFMWCWSLKKWPVSKALGTAITVGVVVDFVGFMAVEFLWMHSENDVVSSISNAALYLWIGLPFVASVAVFVYGRVWKARR